MNVLYRYDVKYPNLKQELLEQIAAGENPYSVALFAASRIFLSIVKDKDYFKSDSDSDFHLFLASIGRRELTLKEEYTGELGDFFDLLLLYYLLIDHAGMTEDFTDTVCWVPGLTRSQRRIMLSWPKKFVLSLFEVQQQGDLLCYKDLKTKKCYSIDKAASKLHMAVEDQKRNIVLSMIVPMGETYLSTPPFFFPLDEFTFAKMNRIKDNCFFGDDLLYRYYKYRRGTKAEKEKQALH